VEIVLPIERTLTHHDHVRLQRLLAQQPAPACAQALQDLLDGSDIVSARELPTTVVTMNSQVLLEEAGGGTRYTLTLCYPQQARPAEGLVSVLSPVGASLLGLRVGETAHWRTPGGHAGAARILALLFQPEAHGDLAA
jgi:regulator of nucleoside diphosphate kinase